MRWTFRTTTGSLRGGLAPVRHYLPDLHHLVWNCRIQLGKVFDLVLPLTQVADRYHATDERPAVKVLLRR